MLRSFIAFLFLVLLAPSALAQEAFLERVIDGDSIRLVMNDQNVEIRLIGIDAPEYRQEWSKAAKRFVVDFLTGRHIEVRFDKQRRDRYGRTLAYVYADTAMLNEALVRNGLALAYPIPPNLRHKVTLARAEAEARKARAGFWKQGGLRLTPREFRKLH
ncbi:thermonuclease family protein [Salidesulfovibrio brasiliensis]|uniref:thermonuclease family protein n=1 Tax=Salidesulfovibrio brasiliensis TaxID=221711 RepID=UPI0009FA53C6|nr:thermonuclease family protein [Salidesulfovibrio brasiliensis]